MTHRQLSPQPPLPALDAKVPAPVLAALVLAAMVAAARLTHQSGDDSPARTVLAIALAVLSAVLALAAMATFWRVRTTIDPFRPKRASTLVTAGLFRWSRNPMYLSLAVLLLSYAVRIGDWRMLLGPLAFVAYVTRFQIRPEEHALEARFGQAYLDYKRRTRRWL